MGDDERPGTSFAPQRSTTMPWYGRTRYVTLLLIFVFPVGLVLLWLRGDWSVRRRGLISGATAVWALILLMTGTTSTPPTTVSLSPAAGQNSTSPIATAATTAVAPSQSPSALPSPSAVKPSPSKAAASTTQATHAATTHAATTKAPTTKTPTTHAATTQAAAEKSTCGAPKNPYGYSFCGTGGHLTSPASDVCSYFQCIASFWNGKGYMVECNDGDFSMSGGIRGACSDHQGVEQAVFSG
ncbi:hypothetical protein [Actinospica robiniae]|uniref:hypothetical protein n=1 Tax=Actinospica robiniae TaxID=304901 RepID=UPI001B7F8EAD|nr:hypothetical protein [Actinospica robiniae]